MVLPKKNYFQICISNEIFRFTSAKPFFLCLQYHLIYNSVNYFETAIEKLDILLQKVKMFEILSIAL